MDRPHLDQPPRFGKERKAGAQYPCEGGRQILPTFFPPQKKGGDDLEVEPTPPGGHSVKSIIRVPVALRGLLIGAANQSAGGH